VSPTDTTAAIPWHVPRRISMAETITVRGMSHDVLNAAIHRALPRGELDDGHMLVVFEKGQPVTSLKIPWRLLVDVDAYWKRAHDVPGEFVINGKPTSGRLKADLKNETISVEY
jgi:hypothetical protein